MTVLGRDRALELAESGCRAALAAGASEAEVVLMTEDSGLTRYAANRIHQHVAEKNAEVRVRAVHGNRVAVATGNQTTPSQVEMVATRAASMAALSSPDPCFPGLPGPPSRPPAGQTTFYESTASVDAERRAETVKGIVRLLEGARATGYGVVTAGITELAVANSRGVHAYQNATDAWLSVIARRSDAASTSGGADSTSTGYATSCHRDWTETDPEWAALNALAKATTGPRRVLPPGRYTVVLEEEAVAEMLMFLAWSALNGLDFLEGRSLYANHLGEKLYPDLITITDDPLDPRSANASFDFEGVPKSPVCLIDRGVVRDVAWDTATAARAGRAGTAHALPAPNTYGPMPMNLVMAPGASSRHDLISQVDRGILITRFHYVNDIDASRTILTGMTRDGTFLIENGEVAAPVQDLRWVESIDSIFRHTVAVGESVRLISQGPGYGLRFLTGSLVPTMLVEGFEITGSKEE